MSLRYQATNQTTRAVTYYDTAEEAIAGIPVTDEEERDFIFTLFGEGAQTDVHNELGETVTVTTVASPPPPAGDKEGGRRKNRRTKTQMRTRKGGRRHMRSKTVKSVGKYQEAPRSRAVFQTEGGRRRRSHRRL